MTKKEEQSAADRMVGKKAPDFKLAGDDGQIHALSEFSGSWLVLYFYPKDMTSGCTTQACDFQASRAQFKKIGANVVGVSKDSIDSHKKFKQKEGLDFLLLSDPECKMLEKYGVWKEKSMYGRKYMGIERTTLVINPKGIVVKAYSKVKVPGHVKSVIEELKGNA